MNDFEYDIFISYTHIDNRPLSDDQKGWVAKLHGDLETRLAMILGEEPRMWRDPRLQGNEVFDDSIMRQLNKVALLVSVLSPRYVRSEWCTRELQEFLRAAEQTGGLRIGDKVRLFKIVKIPIPLEEHPPELKPLLGYEFFEIDPETGHPIEFDLLPDAERRYWSRLNDLAYNMRDLLEQLKARGDGAPATPTGATVYLAETTRDLYTERDDIRRELQQLGHTVLPDRPLPLYGPELESLVRENLERCSLSIHLVGAHYGIVPEAADRSVIALQNALAAERSAASGLTRLIWLPSDLETRDAQQQTFVEALKNDPTVQRGADLLQTTLEDLKTVIQDKLAPREEPEEVPKAAVADDRPPLVYLLCDQRDKEAVVPLEDYLYELGFEVELPLFEGDEAAVREYHQEMLTLCDAVLIYYGDADEPWVKVKVMDLRKAAGYGRAAPMRATAIYVAGPETREKTRFRTRNADEVIKHFDAFSPDMLAPFVQRLNAKRGGPPS